MQNQIAQKSLEQRYFDVTREPFVTWSAICKSGLDIDQKMCRPKTVSRTQGDIRLAGESYKEDFCAQLHSELFDLGNDTSKVYLISEIGNIGRPRKMAASAFEGEDFCVVGQRLVKQNDPKEKYEYWTQSVL